MSGVVKLEKATVSNKNYRKVVYTGDKTQLAVMSIEPGQDIGEETHRHVEQLIFIVSGEARAVLDGSGRLVGSGDVVVVTPGTKHNIINIGKEPLQIATVYSPPNHPDGTIERTKKEADANEADKMFSRRVK